MPESAIIAVEARQGAYDYAKEKMLVWWILLISIKHIATNTQSDVLRTKYDYIFKIKILEFYFGIPLIKTNLLCQKKNLYPNRWSSSNHCRSNNTVKIRLSK
jgi:hypothetical protein